MASRPVVFGPFNVPYLIAHRNAVGGCQLICGDRTVIEGGETDLREFNTYILPPGTVCTVQHERQENGNCQQTIDQRFDRVEVEGESAQQSAPEPLMITNLDPIQLCLCFSGVRTCPVGTDPDCSSGSTICVPFP